MAAYKSATDSLPQGASMLDILHRLAEEHMVPHTVRQAVRIDSAARDLHTTPTSQDAKDLQQFLNEQQSREQPILFMGLPLHREEDGTITFTGKEAKHANEATISHVLDIDNSFILSCNSSAEEWQSFPQTPTNGTIQCFLSYPNGIKKTTFITRQLMVQTDSSQAAEPYFALAQYKSHHAEDRILS